MKAQLERDDFARTRPTVETLYTRWSEMWEVYLQRRLRKVDQLRRGKIAPLEQATAVPGKVRTSKWLRRLANHVNRLRILRDPGHRSEKNVQLLWKQVQAATIPFEAAYGAPQLQGPFTEENVVSQVLAQAEKYYSAIWRSELHKQAHNSKLALREKLNLCGGVNRTMSKILTPEKQMARVLLRQGGEVVRGPRRILQVMYDSWSEYWAKESIPPTTEWKEKYAPQQRQRYELEPLSGEYLKKVLASRSKTSSPGPDSWRYSELALLPLEAMQQLSYVFMCAEEQRCWPSSVSASWTAILP